MRRLTSAVDVSLTYVDKTRLFLLVFFPDRALMDERPSDDDSSSYLRARTVRRDHFSCRSVRAMCSNQFRVSVGLGPALTLEMAS